MHFLSFLQFAQRGGLVAAALSVGLAACAVDGGTDAASPDGDAAPHMTLEEVATAASPPPAFVDSAGVRWVYAGQVARTSAPAADGETSEELAEDEAAELEPLSLVFADGREYITRDTLPRLDIDIPGSGENVHALINGSDGRMQIVSPANLSPPFSRVVFLANSSASCSGAMFGPRHVLTAGHCLHSGKRSGNHYGPTSATPGRVCASGAACAPYGTAGELARIVSSSWRSGIRHRWPDDWAILILDSSLGLSTGWFGAGSTSSSALRDAQVTTYGYPGDKPAGTMWGMSCGVDTVLAQKFRYECDTMNGQSGSGIWIDDKLVGILSNHVLFANRAVRIRDEIVSAMNDARADYP
ncbi:trypsin-like serine peptidase [Sorangium sp. So ce887]|uniref:trypsin-like serine peptidase n=1 Tax=Sorangium sp. So ce887 TaxID=3133324 RepID=UPI003F5F7240